MNICDNSSTDIGIFLSADTPKVLRKDIWDKWWQRQLPSLDHEGSQKVVCDNTHRNDVLKLKKNGSQIWNDGMTFHVT